MNISVNFLKQKCVLNDSKFSVMRCKINISNLQLKLIFDFRKSFKNISNSMLKLKLTQYTVAIPL